MQSHGITLSFHREMADSSRELVGLDEECAEPLLRHGGEGCLELVLAGRSEHLNAAPERLRAA